MKAIYNNQVIAESVETIVIEQDHYFPVASVKMDFLKKNGEISACENEGDACYYDVEINGSLLKDAALSYSQPSEASDQLKNYIVFNEPVQVME